MQSLILAAALFIAPSHADGWTPGKQLARAVATASAVDSGIDQSDLLPAGPTDVSHGADLFKARCVACHGEAGNGGGPAAVVLTPRPADFTDSARWVATSLGTKFWIIQNGVKGTAMAPTGLSDDDTRAVLLYIQQTFAKQ
ncbi:MAG: cytochrome c [Oligoflexia bacterium]|nr:cytochrome c [Oligoflexia bacterium]